MVKSTHTYFLPETQVYFYHEGEHNQGIVVGYYSQPTASPHYYILSFDNYTRNGELKIVAVPVEECLEATINDGRLRQLQADDRYRRTLESNLKHCNAQLWAFASQDNGTICGVYFKNPHNDDQIFTEIDCLYLLRSSEDLFGKSLKMNIANDNEKPVYIPDDIINDILSQLRHFQPRDQRHVTRFCI